MSAPPDPQCLEDLEAVEADIWQRLIRGKADRRAAMHVPVVADTDAHGLPRQRIMVLRAVDRTSASLRFHTDARSDKVAGKDSGAPVSVLAYDPQAKVQLRLSGMGRVERDTPLADSAWASSSLSSRRCYLAEPGPGAETPVPTSGLPADMEERIPTDAESAAGRSHFSVLCITINQIEWLYLAAQGHRRAIFRRNADSSWNGRWLIP